MSGPGEFEPIAVTCEPTIIHSMFCLPCMCYDERRPAVTVFNSMAQCEEHMKAFVANRKSCKGGRDYDFIFKLPL